MPIPRTKKVKVVEAKPFAMTATDPAMVREGRDRTVGDELVGRLRAAGAYTKGDQAAPAAILWPDGERRWAAILPDLKPRIPELYSLGELAAEARTGPAIWLRCIEARMVEPMPPEGATPIFYLPGVSRQDLRAVEDCPPELDPMVELQFRGAVWSHPNGRDWTPYAFLASSHGGLGLDVPTDGDTASALDRSLAALLHERVAGLTGEKLDAEFLNMLLAPDLPVEILRWMNDPEAIRAKKSDVEWQAFCAQCGSEFRLHPEKDGPLHAAELLGNRAGQWSKVWLRFREAPHRYPCVVGLLEKAAPPTEGLLSLDREYWPTYNAEDESVVARALLSLKDARADEAAAAVLRLEKVHAGRRSWVWRDVGRAPLAVALEPLSLLATLVQRPLAGPDATAMADQYAKTVWEVDAAAMAALASGTSPEADEAIATAVRAVYLPWLDQSARNFQNHALAAGGTVRPKLGAPPQAAGRVVVFVDGLRLDVAHRLHRALEATGLQPDLTWDWAAFPSVTPTGKAAVCPMAGMLAGGGPEDEFAPDIKDSGQRWTSDRHHAYLRGQGVQLLLGRDAGDPKGMAWAEVGDLDARGHNEGAKSAKHLDQAVRDIVSRLRELLEAGWREIVVVTDHGWLLIPGGLPKVSLPSHVVEHRWGRCAAMKTTGSTGLPTLPWHWNAEVTIATPPGAGCFRAGVEYAHGGLSVQEMVVPRLTLRAGGTGAGQPRIASVKWVGLRCRITVQSVAPGLLADVRARAADAKSSKLEGGCPRELGADGTVSLPIADDRDAGCAAVVVLLHPDGSPTHSLPTVIGENP
jgi:hypothetical protein